MVGLSKLLKNLTFILASRVENKSALSNSSQFVHSTKNDTEHAMTPPVDRVHCIRPRPEKHRNDRYSIALIYQLHCTQICMTNVVRPFFSISVCIGRQFPNNVQKSALVVYHKDDPRGTSHHIKRPSRLLWIYVCNIPESFNINIFRITNHARANQCLLPLRTKIRSSGNMRGLPGRLEDRVNYRCHGPGVVLCQK